MNDLLAQLSKAWEVEQEKNYPDPFVFAKELGFSFYDTQVVYDEDSGLDKQKIVVLEHFSSGRLFMVSAHYSSWDDTRWEGYMFEEVATQEVTVTKYVPIAKEPK